STRAAAVRCRVSRACRGCTASRCAGTSDRSGVMRSGPLCGAGLSCCSARPATLAEPPFAASTPGRSELHRVDHLMHVVRVGALAEAEMTREAAHAMVRRGVDRVQTLDPGVPRVLDEA